MLRFTGCPSEGIIVPFPILMLLNDDSKYLKEVYFNIEKRLFSQPIVVTSETLIARFDGGLLREYNLGNEFFHFWNLLKKILDPPLLDFR